MSGAGRQASPEPAAEPKPEPPICARLVELAALLERGRPTGFAINEELGPFTYRRMDNGALIASAPVYRSTPVFSPPTAYEREAAVILRSIAERGQP